MSFQIDFGFEDPAAVWEAARLAYFFVSRCRPTDLGKLPGPTAVADAARYAEMFEAQTEIALSSIGIFCEIITEDNPTAAAARRVTQAKEQGIFPIVIGDDRQITAKCCSDPLVALWGKVGRDEKDVAVCTSGLAPILCGLRASTLDAFHAITGKATVITARDIGRQSKKVEAALSLLGRPVHLSIDLDVLAPSVAMSPRSIEPGGLSYYQLIEILEAAFSGPGVAAVDLVGVKHVEPDSPAAALCAQILVKLAGLAASCLEK